MGGLRGVGLSGPCNLAVGLVIGFVMLACGDPNACPQGTEPHLISFRGMQERSCRRPDGTLDGPLVDIDATGRERRRGQLTNGKKQGRWVIWLGDVLIGERHYRDGLLDGPFTLFAPDGQPVIQSYYTADVMDGRQVIRTEAGAPASERFFQRGRRTGTWRRFRDGEMVETRTYSAPDVLHEVDGRVLPVAPDRIQLPDGTVVLRLACEQAPPELSGHSSCLNLFEAYQRCAIDANEHVCQMHAVEDYRAGRSSSF